MTTATDTASARRPLAAPARGLGRLAALLCALLAAGCAGPGRTTVILLPDQGGHVGGVSVTSQAGTRQLDQAWDGLTVAGRGRGTMTDKPGAREPVTAAYQGLLAAHPARPLSLVLYFVLDTTTLTERSKALLPEVFRAARERRPTEITVYGHTDTLGSGRRNLALSEQRARAIAELLKKSDPTLGEVAVQYFGDRMPLVPTAGQVAEPRNRRVEIEIL